MSFLKNLRLSKGLSLNDVAKEVGVSAAQLSRVERGVAGGSPALAERLVRFFGRKKITEEHILYPERFAKKEAA